MSAVRSLPAQARDIIGRERECDIGVDLLLNPDCRLLTLLGTGGIGKTRLAVALAGAVGDRFADGVCFVDLTQIDDPAAFPSLLASQLDLRVVGRSPLQQVQEFLQSRRQLLLLDNFEHVLSGAPVVSEILAVCPDVTVLATSREPLQLRWEQRMPLDGLELPDLRHLPEPAYLPAIPSVALFLERGRAVDLRFQASDEELRHIAEVCVRLDGMPLAIELAAARSKSLTPAAMLKRFDQVLSLLRQDAVDVPPRQQSLRATLEWSYHLLSDCEQVVFRHLGVFVGGCSLDAVTALSGEPAARWDLLEVLSSLVDKGLAASEPTPEGEPRFRLLDTIRSYALELLQQSGELESARMKHARFYLAIAERETHDLRFGGAFVFSPSSAARPLDQPGLPWHAVLDREQANMRVALQWVRDHNEHETLMRLAVALRRYWWMRGFLQEGTYWLELALAQNLNAEAVLRSPALSGLAIMYRQQGDIERARTLLEEAVALTRTLDNTQLLVAQLIDLGAVLAFLGWLPEAMALLEESVTISQSIGDDWGIAASRTFRGGVQTMIGHGEVAEPDLTESLPIFRALGDLYGVILAEAILVRAIGLRGDTRRALPYLEDALDLGRQGTEGALAGLVIDTAAYLLSGVAAPEACARLLGAGDGLRVRGLTRTTFEQNIYDDALTMVRDKLDRETLAAAMQEGTRLTAASAIDEALTLLRSQASTPEAPSARIRVDNGHLSVRELDVVNLLAEGLSNREIGERLGISDNTVKFHVTSILKKLGVKSRVEVVTAAMRLGLL